MEGELRDYFWNDKADLSSLLFITLATAAIHGADLCFWVFMPTGARVEMNFTGKSESLVITIIPECAGVFL